jgi:hypothetical protein
MKQLMERALAETAALWEPLRRAYRWVAEAAHLLANPEEPPAPAVRQAFVRVLRSIGVTKRHCGPLEAAWDHFLTVRCSYQAG